MQNWMCIFVLLGFGFKPIVTVFMEFSEFYWLVATFLHLIKSSHFHWDFFNKVRVFFRGEGEKPKEIMHWNDEISKRMSFICLSWLLLDFWLYRTTQFTTSTFRLEIYSVEWFRVVLNCIDWLCVVGWLVGFLVNRLKF